MYKLKSKELEVDEVLLLSIKLTFVLVLHLWFYSLNFLSRFEKTVNLNV